MHDTDTSDPVATAYAARDLLNTAAAAPAETALDHTQLSQYGRVLTSVLDTVDDLVLNLTNRVAHYGDDLILRDDRDADPVDRLGDACDQLGELHTNINAARRHAHHYWSAISHIGVQADPYAISDTE